MSIWKDYWANVASNYIGPWAMGQIRKQVRERLAERACELFSIDWISAS